MISLKRPGTYTPYSLEGGVFRIGDPALSIIPGLMSTVLRDA